MDCGTLNSILSWQTACGVPFTGRVAELIADPNRWVEGGTYSTTLAFPVVAAQTRRIQGSFHYDNLGRDSQVLDPTEAWLAGAADLRLQFVAALPLGTRGRFCAASLKYKRSGTVLAACCMKAVVVRSRCIFILNHEFFQSSMK